MTKLGALSKEYFIVVKGYQARIGFWGILCKTEVQGKMPMQDNLVLIWRKKQKRGLQFSLN